LRASWSWETAIATFATSGLMTGGGSGNTIMRIPRGLIAWPRETRAQCGTIGNQIMPSQMGAHRCLTPGGFPAIYLSAGGPSKPTPINWQPSHEEVPSPQSSFGASAAGRGGVRALPLVQPGPWGFGKDFFL